MVNSSIFVSGHFNVLHPGHLRLLRFAKELGGRLIVAVESDRLAGNAAHVLERLRLEGVQSIGWVDEAFIVDEPVASVVRRLRPEIVVKGKEHELRLNLELAELVQYGGKLVFSSGEASFSSLDLIRKEFIELDSKSINLPLEFQARHGISSSRLSDLLQKFQQLKVCVVGDMIIDEYITCQPLGMSQEDPTICLLYTSPSPRDRTRSRMPSSA